MKWIVVAFFVGILGALAWAGRAMLNDGRDGRPKTHRMVKALAWRVGLSIALFVLLLFSYLMGWIQPTGIALSH